MLEAYRDRLEQIEQRAEDAAWHREELRGQVRDALARFRAGDREGALSILDAVARPDPIPETQFCRRCQSPTAARHCEACIP